MNITAYDEVLGRILQNKLETHISDGYALPVRFTEKQLDLYASLGNGFKGNSLCTAGICLDFITDSGFLKLKVAYGKADKQYAAYDLYIDNYFVNSINSSPEAGEDCVVTFKLSENIRKDRRITIYLPHVVATYIKEIELEDNSSIKETPGRKMNYLCLGGSISQGMTSKKPSSMYAIQLARILDMNLINQGVGGYYYEADSLDENLPYSADLITVAYGGNEARICKSMDEFKDRCFRFMEKLAGLYPAARVFVIPPTWRRSYNNVMTIGSHYDVARMINEVCGKYSNVHVFDGLKLVPHMESLYDDGLHPTDEGFLHFTINMLPDILKEFR